MAPRSARASSTPRARPAHTSRHAPPPATCRPARAARAQRARRKLCRRHAEATHPSLSAATHKPHKCRDPTHPPRRRLDGWGWPAAAAGTPRPPAAAPCQGRASRRRPPTSSRRCKSRRLRTANGRTEGTHARTQRAGLLFPAQGTAARRRDGAARDGREVRQRVAGGFWRHAHEVFSTCRSGAKPRSRSRICSATCAHGVRVRARVSSHSPRRSLEP